MTPNFTSNSKEIIIILEWCLRERENHLELDPEKGTSCWLKGKLSWELKFNPFQIFLDIERLGLQVRVLLDPQMPLDLGDTWLRSRFSELQLACQL